MKRHATTSPARDPRRGYSTRGGVRRIVAVVIIILALFARATTTVAEEPPSTTNRDAAATAPGVHPGGEPDEPLGDPDPAAVPRLDPRKEQVVTAAVWLLAGVAFVGALLIGMIVLWGFRVRRQARAPLPKTARPDELWYLRAKAGLPPDGKPPPGTSRETNERTTGGSAPGPAADDG